jgi:hypothetical protein
MSPGQLIVALGDNYDKVAIARELQKVYQQLNDVIISPAQSKLKTTYAAADLTTAASVAAALNSTNTAINAILSKLNLS